MKGPHAGIVGIELDGQFGARQDVDGVAAKSASPVLARRHAIWGLGQLAAKTPDALASVRTLIADGDSEVRAQAMCAPLVMSML